MTEALARKPIDMSPDAVTSRISTGLGVTFLERAKMGWAVDDLDVRGVIATRPAKQVVDAFVDGYPELKGLANTIKSDEALLGAFHKAMSKDETMLPGLRKMAATPAGAVFLKETEKLLQDPSKRALLTEALNNVADKDDIKFDHLENLVKSAATYDHADMEKSDAKLVAGLQGVGLTRDQSTQFVAQEKTKEFVKGFQDFFKNPDQGLGKFGSMLENIGMNGGIAGMIVGILQLIIKGIGNLPGFISNSYRGSQLEAFKEVHIDPAIERTTSRGQTIIDAHRATSQLDQGAVKSGEKGALKKASAGPINGTDLSGDKTRDADTPSGFVPPRPATSPPALGLQ